MFKEVFRLRPKSWHARLMKRMWNLDHYDFSHMCPYFWLSVFNVILMYLLQGWLLILIFKGLKWLLQGIGTALDMLSEYLEEVKERQKEREEEKARRLIDELFHQIQEKSPTVLKRIASANFFERKWNDPLRRAWERFQKITAPDEVEVISNHIREFRPILTMPKEREPSIQDDYFHEQVRKREKERAEQKRLRMIAAKRRINAILRITKPIVTFLAYCAGAFMILVVLWLIWLAIKAMGRVEHETYREVGHITLQIFMWIAIGVSTVVVFILLWKHLFSKIRIRLPRINLPEMSEETEEKISNLFRNIWKPFKWFFRLLGKVFKAIGEFFALCIQMFKNQCPPIEWVDE